MNTGTYKLPSILSLRLAPPEGFLADAEFVPFKTTGRVCAEAITPDPPRIPMVSAGKGYHTTGIIDYLHAEKKAGVRRV